MKKRFLAILTIVMVLTSMTACASSTLPDIQGDSLKELSKDDGFLIGAAFSYNQLRDQRYIQIVKHHFGSVTPTNELKAYSLLDQRASQKTSDGSPAMNYSKADDMLTFAQANGLKVRGHVLVWDAYMTDWFFREGYSNGAAFVDQKTMRTRLQSYIEQVMTHFEEKFPGLVYCWDVVNEAVGDSAGEFEPDDPRRLRLTRNGAPNLFYQCVGDDYVELSFQYARDTAEKLGADIRLFYNDYNAFMFDKSIAIRELAKSINTYARDENGEYRKLIDGIGMQGYIGGYGTQSGCMNDADLPKIKAAIEGYAEMGMEVQLTEMAVRTYENDDATMEKHAAFYGKLFKLFKSINRNIESKPLTGVSIWGLFDCPSLPKNNYTYKLNSPYGGLFTERSEPKAVLDTLYEVLKEK